MECQVLELRSRATSWVYVQGDEWSSPMSLGASRQLEQHESDEAGSEKTFDVGVCKKHTCLTHLLVCLLSVDDIIQGENDGGDVTKPLGTKGHCCGKTCVEASDNPCSSIVRGRILPEIKIRSSLAVKTVY
jgi:hypothetical protein